MDKVKIESLFEPHSKVEFLKSFYGKSFVHINGEKKRFNYLLSWEALNCILRQHRLDHPRIRLSKDGKNIPTGTFIRYLPARRGGTIPHIVANSLTEQLRNGATLIIDAIDEAHDPVAELVESLERLLRENIQVNAYVGWGETNGFDLHWDDHDVIILQVAGRKNWKLYNPTRLYPMYRDVEPNLIPPKEAPIWEGTLKDGDLLYIPRGWWHVALPVNEPTIHLTFGIVRRSGIDLLSWLTDQLRSIEICRMDLPRFSDPTDQLAHLNKLKQELLTVWDNGILEKFFQDIDAKAQPRTHMSLPWAVQPDVLPATDEITFKLTIPRSGSIEESGDQIKFTANSKSWWFAKQADPILRYLQDNRICSLKDLYHISEGILPKETVKLFLGELILQGIIAINSVQEHFE